MRTPLIAGNWKMHGSRSQLTSLLTPIKEGAAGLTAIEVLVVPVFVYLSVAHDLLAKSNIKLGAQDIYPGAQGAFTGEVAGSMLKDVGCQYVLIGHSERRTLFQEGLELVAAKFKAALEAGLTPILCVGETRAEREAGQTEAVIKQQLDSVIQYTDIDVFAKAVIAYEPVWAIGTGLTATPEQAQDVHQYIRKQIAQNNVDIADTIRILYGGSMKADNAPALLAMPDIDGGLIGGASLDASSFLAICQAASRELTAS